MWGDDFLSGGVIPTGGNVPTGAPIKNEHNQLET